jgi:hypothetical protein
MAIDFSKLSFPPRFDPSSIQIDETSLWADAYEEYDSEKRIKGLWAKLFVQCNGDEKKIKIEYVRCRAEQLIFEAKKNFFEIQKKEYEDKVALEHKEAEELQQLEIKAKRKLEEFGVDDALKILKTRSPSAEVAVRKILGSKYDWVNPSLLCSQNFLQRAKWEFKSKTSSMSLYFYSISEVIEFSNSIE